MTSFIESPNSSLLLPVSSRETRDSFFKSEAYTNAKGTLHISDVHLGMYCIEDDHFFEERVRRIGKKIQQWEKSKTHKEKIGILKQRLETWKQRREAGLHAGGLQGFNKRLTLLVNMAIEEKLLFHLNGDIFDLVPSNTSGEQVCRESECLIAEIQRYYTETGRQVLYTPGNHDERNLHRKSTVPIRDFLMSESVLVMPKMWWDERGRAVITHGDFPGYRESCLARTCELLKRDDFPRNCVRSQLEMILGEIDSDNPKGAQGIADGIIGTFIETIVERVGRRKARQILEKFYLGRLYKYHKGLNGTFIPDQLRESFLWLDMVVQMALSSEQANNRTDPVAIITGHTHYQLLRRVENENAFYIDANSGSLMGSVVNLPSCLVQYYEEKAIEILEWGNRIKEKKGILRVSGGKWHSKRTAWIE